MQNKGKGHGRTQKKELEDEMQSFGSPEDFDRDVAICKMKERGREVWANDGAEKMRCKFSVPPKTFTGSLQ
jgi:hypothetical protein